MDNLLSNAIKYAPGSPVTLALDLLGDNIHVAIADQGPGIAPEHLDQIFKRFYRVPEHASVRGTGLGLYICRQIIRAHGGQITVESKLGEGTTFHLYLPSGDGNTSEKSLANEEVAS